ncbi:MAG: putative PEP-binding protein [Clostridium sp.]
MCALNWLPTLESHRIWKRCSSMTAEGVGLFRTEFLFMDRNGYANGGRAV